LRVAAQQSLEPSSSHVRKLDPRLLEGRLVVLSPHLDDAALSLGATIAHASGTGSDVTIVTVRAGNPESTVPAGEWDRGCGFSTVGEAARERRREDERACEILGATPQWLPFPDANHPEKKRDDTIWPEIATRLANADLVFAPGFPLEHPSHAWLTRLVLERAPADTRLAFYVEQPYTNLLVMRRGYSLDTIGRTLRIVLRTPIGRRLQQPGSNETIRELVSAIDWKASPADRRERRAKDEAIRAYASQLDLLGLGLISRIRLYEWGWGGEGIGLPAQ
jgi:LmbE family N-acetylglucosaminyl deacetylase